MTPRRWCSAQALQRRTEAGPRQLQRGRRRLIPNLEIAHVSTARFVRSHQNVSLEFLATAIAAVEQSVELQGVRKLDVTAARDTLQFLKAFRPVLDRIRALADSLEFTMKSRRASLTADALQIYAIAKAVAPIHEAPRSPRSSMI
jgi:hypothetical protein